MPRPQRTTRVVGRRGPRPALRLAGIVVATLLGLSGGCQVLVPRSGDGPGTPPAPSSSPAAESEPPATGAAPSTVTAPPPIGAEPLSEAMSASAVLARMAVFERIADEHDGNRATGTPGYTASLDHVAAELRAAGYTVTEQPFSYPSTEVRAQRADRVGGGSLDLPITAMQGSPSTGADGVEAVAVTPSGDPLGCRAADYGPDARGAIAVAERGTCPFAVKSEQAGAAGAVALIFVDNEESDRGLTGTLGPAGEADRVPTAGLGRTAGGRLTAAIGDGEVRLRVVVDILTTTREGRNLIADGPIVDGPGAGGRVVMAGAHLDSVPAGPGVNDNASGSALVVELAVRLAELGQQANTRFAFWDAEEVGLVGSRHYVDGLTDTDREQLAAYLNLDMVASPNGAPQAYGTDAIRTRLADAVAARGRTLGPAGIGGASDHAPFEQAGIPVGGLFTGAGETKSPEQAREWGGRAGEPMDRCYHADCDRLATADDPAVAENLELIADAVIVVMAQLLVDAR